jgi:hypothetical protein
MAARQQKRFTPVHSGLKWQTLCRGVLGVWEVVEVIQLSNYPAIQHGHGIFPYFRLLWPCLFGGIPFESCTLLAEDVEMLTLGGFNIPKAIVTVHSAGYL